ncbi:MAG: hypothetical protein ACTSPY_09890 [Candidatus Helarchaeota archaeon]
MDSALEKYSIEEIKKLIEKNKKIEINDENIKNGLKGICALCGEPWDMALHWDTVMGNYDNEEYLLIENTKFGVVHDVCNILFDEGEFQDLNKALESKEVKEIEKEQKKPEKKIKKEVKVKPKVDEELPIHETLEIVKAYTFRKSDKWWTAIAATKSTLSKNPKTILAFYRWRKDKNGKWKRIKKWTINSKEDWEKFKKIINQDFIDILWK